MSFHRLPEVCGRRGERGRARGGQQPRPKKAIIRQVAAEQRAGRTGQGRGRATHHDQLEQHLVLLGAPAPHIFMRPARHGVSCRPRTRLTDYGQARAAAPHTVSIGRWGARAGACGAAATRPERTPRLGRSREKGPAGREEKVPTVPPRLEVLEKILPWASSALVSWRLERPSSTGPAERDRNLTPPGVRKTGSSYFVPWNRRPIYIVFTDGKLVLFTLRHRTS